jgi:hypothetical protein
MKLFLLCLLSLGLGLSSSFAMSKKAKFIITFHCQGDDMASPRTIFRQAIPGHQHPVVFEKVPQFSHYQVAAFHGFPAENGQGNGVALQLDFRGKNALDLITRTREGEILLAMINGQPVDYVQIDGPIHDGLITIWRNVPQECLDELAKKYPPISGLKSASDGHEEMMLPTTKAEKRRSLNQSKDEARASERDSKREPEPEKPNPLEQIAIPAKPEPIR